MTHNVAFPGGALCCSLLAFPRLFFCLSAREWLQGLCVCSKTPSHAGTQELDKDQQTVQQCTSRLEALAFDEAAMAQLEATAAQEKAEVARCKERIDVLSSQLTGKRT
jgi:hypothetical protein